MRQPILTFVVAIGLLPANAVSSATIEILTPWSLSANSTRPVQKPSEAFAGRTYILRSSSDQHGKLSSASVELSGRWSSTATSNQTIDESTGLASTWTIYVNENTDNTTLGTNFISTETVGAFSVGESVARGEGEFTNTDLSAPLSVDDFPWLRVSFASATVTSVGGPQDDGIFTTGRHTAEGNLKVTYSYDSMPADQRRIVITAADFPQGTVTPAPTPPERILISVPDETGAVAAQAAIKDIWNDSADTALELSELFALPATYLERVPERLVRYIQAVSDSASGTTEGLSRRLRALAEDPPRFDYDELAPVLMSGQTFDFSEFGPDTTFLEEAFLSGEYSIALLNSSLTTFERLQGAILDDNSDAIDLQSEHLSLLLAESDLALGELSSGLNKFSAQIGAEGELPQEFFNLFGEATDFLASAQTSSWLTATQSTTVAAVPIPNTGMLMIFAALALLGAPKTGRKRLPS